MTAEIQQLSARGVEGMMEFRSKARERVSRIERHGGGGIGLRPDQTGACMTVPQTLHVRCSRLE